MILFLIEWLAHLGIRLPAAFGYFSTRMILASITSLMISIFLGPFFIRKLYELKIGQTIRTAECAPLLNQLHRNKKDTPTMGGVLILFSILVSLLLWMDLRSIFTLILLIGTLSFGMLGGYDDYFKIKYKNSKGVSGRMKLLMQGGVALVIALYLLSPLIQDNIQIGKWFAPPLVKENIHLKNYVTDDEPVVGMTSMATVPFSEFASRLYFPFKKEWLIAFSGMTVVLMGLFILFVIVGSSNAVNLTDGLDGLAAGCLIMVAACLAAVAFLSNNVEMASYLNIPYIEGSGEIAIFLSAFIGGCLGFLWYNGHPAQVFMGDTGSLALGGLIGISAVLLKREFLLGLVGGIFVMEALSVILQVTSFRLRNKKRIFLCAPLHHHFEYKGWPETKVVLRFWIIGLLLAIIGLASIKLQ